MISNETIERIRNYMGSGAVAKDASGLSPKDYEVYCKLQSMYAMLENMNTSNFIVNHFIEQHGYSDRQARAYLAAAKNLFGDIDNISKKAKRLFISAWLEQALVKAFNAADYDAFAKLTKQYASINLLDKEDKTDIDLSMLRNSYVNELSPATASAMAKLLSSDKAIDISELFATAEEAEFIEVEPNAENG